MTILRTTLLCLTLVLITACDIKPIEKKVDTFKAEYTFQDPKVIELARALKIADLEQAEKLIENGANFNAVGKDNLNLLYWLTVKVEDGPKRRKSFEYLLQKGADPLVFHATTGETLFHLSSNHVDSFFLEKIIEYNPGMDLDIEVKNQPMWPTAIYQSILANRNNNLKVLVENGANIEHVTKYGRKPIDKTQWDESLILLKAGADYRGGPIGYFSLTVDEIPDIIWSLENNHSNGKNRSAVIKFLEQKGVELYPWYPKDDPRYNPRPEEKKINPYKDYYKQYYDINKALICPGDERRDIYNDLTEEDFNSWVPYQGAALTIESCHKNVKRIIMSGIDTEITYQVYNLEKFYMVEVKLEIYDKFRTNQDAKIEKTRKAVILYNQDLEPAHTFQDSVDNQEYLIPVERFIQY